MRLLFEIDTKDYNPNGIRYIRPSSRAIIIKDNKVGMVHSLRYDYYKFPGGGIDANESKEEALVRETKEEAGLVIKKESIKEFGYVHRVEHSNPGDPFEIFEQDNFYYVVEVEDFKISQKLDDYEDYEHFTLEFVDPLIAIDTNRNKNHGPKDQIMIEREARVLEILLKEKYL